MTNYGANLYLHILHPEYGYKYVSHTQFKFLFY